MSAVESLFMGVTFGILGPQCILGSQYSLEFSGYIHARALGGKIGHCWLGIVGWLLLFCSLLNISVQRRNNKKKLYLFQVKIKLAPRN